MLADFYLGSLDNGTKIENLLLRLPILPIRCVDVCRLFLAWIYSFSEHMHRDTKSQRCLDTGEGSFLKVV